MDSRKMKRNVCTSRVALKSAAIFLVGLGAVLAIFWPQIFERILNGQLVLGPHSKAFEQWKSPSVPLYFDVYFFNWTNSEEFLDETKKPIMKEVGPYRFREVRDKKNITFNSNSTVSYRPTSTFFFDEEGSNGTLDDVITQLNIVAVGASAKALSMEYTHRKYVSIGLNSYEQKINISKTARELLFEGYEDDMVSMGRSGLLEGFDLGDNPYDKIGWLYLRNATDKLSGTYNVHTGLNDIMKLGTIENYNFSSNNKVYSGECSKLHGSVGELFPPRQTRESVNLFVSDLCRSIPFDYEKDVEVHGVTGYRFSAGRRAVDNGTNYPENLCYGYGSAEHVPSGVMNISACRYGSPVFMSYPHFFLADDFYLNEIDGLAPSKEKHESYFTLDPNTGAPLEVTIRFQANLFVQPNENVGLFQDVPKIFIPAMWFEQKFVLDEETTQKLKLAGIVPWAGQVVGLVMVMVGTIFLTILCITSCLQSRKTSKRQQMEINLNENEIAARQKKEVSPLLNRNLHAKIMQQKRRP